MPKLPIPTSFPAPDLITVVPELEKDWTFRCPRLTDEVVTRFDNLLELRDQGDLEGAERGLHQMALEFPEFIDVFHHLGLVYMETGRDYAASAAWKYAATIGLVAIPIDFKVGRHRLPWDIIENRPFFRACHSWGLDLVHQEEVGLALNLFRNMLLWNPDDNMGIRALVVNCYFMLNRPDGVLQVCHKHGGGWGLEELLFGLPLAMFMLGDREGARKAFLSAAGVYPLIAKEIVGKQHRLPYPLSPTHVTMGSVEQARLYWHESAAFWKAAPGAVEFFRAFANPASMPKIIIPSRRNGPSSD